MKEAKRLGGVSGMLEEDMVPLSSFIAKKKGNGRAGGRSSGKKRGSGLSNVRTRSKTTMMSDTESDKDLVVCGKNGEGSLKNKREVRNNKKGGRREPGKCEDAKTCGEKINRSANVRKRGRMDVFEYNEDDMVDIKKIKEDLNRGRRDKERELKTACGSGNVVDKKKSSSFCEKSGLSAKRNRVADLLDKKRSEMKEDEVSLPLNTQREKDVDSVNKPSRTLGQTGVFKVMVNDKKESGLEKTYDYFPEKPCSSVITEENQLNLQIISTDNDKAHCSRTDSNTSLQLGSENVNPCGTLKEERNEGEATLTFESCLSARSQEGGVTRLVEKGLIRDLIKTILMNEGWKIDFRPRRNRNYNDAVYINPSGSVYWSIVNAYNAVKKQYEDEASDSKPSRTSSSFTPIPDNFLNQLTRQTRKKTMREKMMKLGVKKSGKSTGETSKKTSFKNGGVKHGKGSARGIRLTNSLKVKAEANSSGGNKKMSKLARVHSAPNASSAHRRKNKRQRGYALLARNSSKDMNLDDDGFSPYAGKRTVMSWMIDEGIVQLNGKVKYMNKRRTRAMMEGQISRDGIHCGCCSKTLTLLDFEIHAGSKLHQPFENIFIETGATLLECLLNAWNKLEESEHSGFRYVDYNDDDPNDDTCCICGDGGDLICCDSCPSTFHQSCLSIEDLPSGDWHCVNCVCKFCGVVGGSNDQAADATISKFHTCSLCEQKYHGSCAQQTDVASGESNSQGLPFCEQKCKEIFEKLQKLLGSKQELEGGYTWTLIQRSDLDTDTPFLGLTQKAECNSKLAVALSVMDECFLPIVDRRSGINLIHNVIYNCGSNFNRLNFSGFYTAVLERGDEMISAASIRIHGTRLAEMPFIGTRHIYRRQGMCRRLLSAIESALCSLGVMKLIIPAIDELMHAWTIVFGFKLLEESHKEEMRSMNMLVFPGTDLLHKILLKQGNVEGAATKSLAVTADELESNRQMKHEMTSKSSRCSCITVDIVASDETLANGTTDRVSDARGADSPSANCSMPDTSDAIDNPSDAPHSLHLASCGEETASDDFQSRSEFRESHAEASLLAEVGSKPVMDSIAEHLQSIESDGGDAHDINVRVDDGECDLHLLDKISGQCATEVVCELPDTSSGSNNLVTDGGVFQCNTDLTDQNTCEMENKLDVVSGVESIATHCEQSIIHSSDDSSEHDGGGVKTEVAAVA